ncbi:hypothetical protein Lesp02_67270 [Lentzea sp. NBRC 105346]|nr:hypothetical protein Lesp02_67270 [Lentzea sp. NBRC 105346]
MLLFLAGCGTARSAAPSTVLDADGYAAEVRSTYPKMRWPADVRPDLDALITATTPPPDEAIQPGLSRQVLGVVNTCAWYRSWDAATGRGDAEQAKAGLRVITDVVTQYPPEVDRAGRDYVRDAAAHAADGNPDLVRDYVEANCFDTKWSS